MSRFRTLTFARMNSMPLALVRSLLCSLSASLILLSSAAHVFAADEPIRHSLFIAGPSFTGIIDEQGKEIWNSGRAGARDGFVLKNGNVLIAWADEVVEQTREKKVVFRYHLAKGNQEIGTVQRLADGRTMITEHGPKPRILEVDPAGKIAAEVALQPETDNAHMQTRMARKLPNGNYLAPHMLAFALKEYDPKGKVVRTMSVDLPELGGRKAEIWPFTAIAFDAADHTQHTLVTLTHGNLVAEFDAAGKVVWKLSNDDLADKPLADPCGAQRLPNGNVVIASYGTRGKIKVFEVTPAKQLVWQYAGKHNAHEIQVLTTNGKPVEGTPMK
jgi:hypothetical protein